MLNRTQRRRSCLGIEAYENLKLGVSGKLNIFILAVKNTPQSPKVWFWRRKVGCERVPIISLRFIINSRQKPIISFWWPGVLYDVVSRYPVDTLLQLWGCYVPGLRIWGWWPGWTPGTAGPPGTGRSAACWTSRTQPDTGHILYLNIHNA